MHYIEKFLVGGLSMFKKSMTKIITLFLVLSILATSMPEAAFASSKTNKIVYTRNAVIINGKKYTEKEIDALLSKAIDLTEASSLTNSSRSYPTNGNLPSNNSRAIAVYFIPGIGQVLLLATGVILLGGVAIKAGSVLGKKISAYINQQNAIKAIKSKIPSRVKKKNGEVDLGKFKNKIKGKNAYKEKGGWQVEKDNAGHGGRRWKLKNKSGKRIGSLDSNGKVLGA